MEIHRQIFLAGARTAHIARHTHEAFKSYSPQDRAFIINRYTQYGGIEHDEEALLDAERAFEAVDRALRHAFSAWREKALAENLPVLNGSKLSVAGEICVLAFLPVGPMDYGRTFLDALSDCAHYYLSYGSPPAA